MKKIIELEQPTQETWKLFFGDHGGLLNVNKVDYPVIMNTFKKLFSDVWAWTAVDFQADILGWEKLDSIGQRIFLLNNAYQTVMDSGVVNIYNYLAMLSSNTELKLGYQYIAQNESIHAGSYNYGLSQMRGNEAEAEINIVFEDNFIKKRMDSEIDFSEELINYVVIGGNRDKKAKEIIFKAIVATYVLESIKFPFSFFSTWSLNKTFDNGINGFSNLLKLIAQDELTGHVPMNRTVLKILKRESRQGFQEVWDKDFIYDYVLLVAKQEKNWSEYLLKEGELANYNRNINKNFIEYHADKALKDLGLEPIYKVKKNDTIDWFNTYRQIKNQNASLQETSNVSYNKGIIKNDIRLNLDKLRSIYNEEK